MREILLIVSLIILGGYTYSLSKKVSLIEKEKEQIVVTQKGIKDTNLAKATAAEERAKEAETALQEASLLGLTFKEDLDATRAKLQVAEKEILSLRNRIFNITVSQNSVSAPASGTYNYRRSEQDSAVEAQIQTLLKNYKEGMELLSQASRREGHYAAPAALKSNFAASSVDRKNYEDHISSEIRRLGNYVSSVESKLRSLGYVP